MKYLFKTLFISLLFTNLSFGHSGGLNGQGCHNNNKTGGYHCHQKPGWNTGDYPSRSISSYECRIDIGDQYYEFDPADTNAKLKFDANNGEVEIICY